MQYENPFDVINQDSASPIIFTVEHSGNSAPGMNFESDALMKKYDTGARDIAARLADTFQAFAIFGNYSRLMIDLNRELSIGLDVQEQTFANEIWRPYHNRIQEKISELMTASITPIFISIHTMRESWPQDIAFLFDTDRRVSDFMQNKFAESLPDIVVGMNEPFDANIVKGTLTINAEPLKLSAVEIEFNRRLLSDPEKLSRCIACIEDGIRNFTT